MSTKRLLQATTTAALLTVAAVVVLQPSTPEAQAQSAAPNPPVCDRTPQIRDAIVYWVSTFQKDEVSDCAEVTAEHLARLDAFEANGVGLPSFVRATSTAWTAWNPCGWLATL